jgi:hypothetical protein
VESPARDRERQLLAGLCAALPELREHAERGLWSEELDGMVGELAAGGSAAEVSRRLGLIDTAPDAQRGDEEPGDEPGIDGAHLAGLAEVTLSGDYRCPSARRCARRGQRDDRGRVPVCALFGVPMAYRS